MRGRPKGSKDKPRQSLGTCAVEGCTFNVLALGLCQTHYQIRQEAEREEAKRKMANGETVVFMSKDGHMLKGPGSGTGRPPALECSPAILKRLRELGRLQCQLSETAGDLFCTTEELRDFLERDERAAVAYYGGKESGKVSLRQEQFSMVPRSAAMSIWLGKQYLNQRERMELGPIQGDSMVDELGDSPTALLRAVREESE